MESKQLDGDRIRRMTKEGIWYEDNEGTEQFIDFESCYQNYVQESLSPERWERNKELNHKTDDEWDEYEAKTRRFKYVADRNILTPPWADGPFIEFYTTPRISFKFQTESQFRKVRRYIELTGHRTGDLS